MTPTMTDHFHILKPGYNRSVDKGTENNDEPTLLPARNGKFCDREYEIIKRALNKAPELVEHVTSMLHAGSQNEDNIKAGKEAPVPFNLQAFNDANEVYSLLAKWVVRWSQKLKRDTTGFAYGSWRKADGTITGLPVGLTPQAARGVTQKAATWLHTHLDDIMWQEPSDDVLYFHDELRMIYSVAARWPTEMRVRYAKIPCPTDLGNGDCNGKIVVYPPTEPGDKQKIICTNPACNRVFDEADFGNIVNVFKQKQDEIDRAQRTRRRLEKKYSA